MDTITVDSQFFARALFSRNFVKIKSSRNGEIILSFTDIGKSCHSRDFFRKYVSKIKLSRKFPNLQYQNKEKKASYRHEKRSPPFYPSVYQNKSTWFPTLGSAYRKTVCGTLRNRSPSTEWKNLTRMLPLAWNLIKGVDL